MTVSFSNAVTTTSVDDLIYEEIIDMSVIDATYSARVMAPLMRQVSLAGKASDTKSFPRWPALTAASVAETTDLVNTPIATTQVSITVGEVGIVIAITDNTQEDDIISGLAEYGAQGGKALADKQDADAAALLAGFSNVTGTATAMTQERWLDAIGALEARDAPGPYVGVLHPVQAHQFRKDVAESAASIHTTTTDARVGNQPGYVGNWYGVDMFQSTNVPADGDDGGDPTDIYEGAMFTKGQALAWLSKREARSEFERDASARLTEITLTSRYGVGELVDEYGETIWSSRV